MRLSGGAPSRTAARLEDRIYRFERRSAEIWLVDRSEKLNGSVGLYARDSSSGRRVRPVPRPRPGKFAHGSSLSPRIDTRRGASIARSRPDAATRIGAPG